MVANIFLFHGKGGRPTGSVLQLEELLRVEFPTACFMRPDLKHGDPTVSAEDSLGDLRRLKIPNDSIVIGISLGGLLAAKLQETGREDLVVACISSPTWADGVMLCRNMRNRLALYSSQDEVINGRTSRWPELAEAFDLPWLTHDTDAHKEPLVEIAASFLRGEDVRTRIATVVHARTRKRKSV